MRLGRVCGSLVLLALSVLIPFRGSADATPFTILPNGDLEIDVAYTTQGVLTCTRTAFPCSRVGTNSLVFGLGTNRSFAVTFFGVSATVPVIGGAKTHVPIGTLVTASTTNRFTFPPLPVLFALRLTLDQSSPVAGTDQMLWGFGLGGGRTQPSLEDLGGGSFLQLPIGPQPPPYRYSSLVYSIDPYPFTLPSSGIVDVGANLGAIPEPTTLLLWGATVAGAGLLARRRRKMKAPSIK